MFEPNWYEYHILSFKPSSGNLRPTQRFTGILGMYKALAYVMVLVPVLDTGTYLTIIIFKLLPYFA
jgi:hypothetical protein